MSCAVRFGCPEHHKRLYGKSSYAQQVKYVSLALTERWTLRCGRCFVRRSASDVEAIQKELTQHEWFDILDPGFRRGDGSRRVPRTPIRLSPGRRSCAIRKEL